MELSLCVKFQMPADIQGEICSDFYKHISQSMVVLFILG